MKFDVIVGNPPYQLSGGAGGSSDSSIYHLFVQQAFKLEPHYAMFVIPSRWMAGGRGMDNFRASMLQSKHISHLVDYTRMSTAFPGVDFEGGVGFFLWDKKHRGDCKYTLFQGDDRHPSITRKLGAYDIFIRDHRALSILDKVRAKAEPTVELMVSSDTPFGLATNFDGWRAIYRTGQDRTGQDRTGQDRTGQDIVLHLVKQGKRLVGYMPRSKINKNTHLIDSWKVLLTEAYGERGAIPALVLGQPIIAGPNSACTQTYLVAGPFNAKSEAESFHSYLNTRFFRFLVSLRKITQHALRSTYRWVPQQKWDRTWTNKALYKKYGLSKDEVAFIESVIRPMEGAE